MAEANVYVHIIIYETGSLTSYTFFNLLDKIITMNQELVVSPGSAIAITKKQV